ncbi:MAG: hypothetical protein ABSB19_20550 [Methylomonas sp.]|jgi:protein gp37
MPKCISEQVRQRIIQIAAQQGFVVQLKDGVQDQYVKNLMLYSKRLNQTVYIRKDRAVGVGGIPDYFHVAVHPNFFNKNWASVEEGIEELINRQKKKICIPAVIIKSFRYIQKMMSPAERALKLSTMMP